MSATELSAIAPLAVLGGAAVLLILLLPFCRAAITDTLAVLALILAALLSAMQTGGLPLPVTAMLSVDDVARFGWVLVCLSAAIAVMLFHGRVAYREAAPLIVLAALGAATLAAAAHGAALFIGLELLTLPLIALFAFPLTLRALEAGYKYLIVSGIGSAALLMGFAFIYAATGALEIGGWRGSGPLMSLAVALLLAGIGFKLALIPFHMWSPDVFEGGPPGAAAVAGILSKAGAAIAVLRLNQEAALPAEIWHTGLLILGAASALGGNLLALRQTDLLRMLGYSSVAHSGYLALILGCHADLSGAALLFYLGIYAPGLLAALGVAAATGGSPDLVRLRGLVRRRPVLAIGLALALVSLAGLPVTGGFIGKIYLFAALIEAQVWAALISAAVGAALGIFVYARFAAAVLHPESAETDGVAAGAERPRMEQALIGALIIVVVGLGIYPPILIDVLP